MTDNEIIKALECCLACRRPEDCTDCPYVECTSERGCVLDLAEDAVDLINRQKAEIESAKKVAEEAIRGFNRMESLCHIKCAELKTTKAEAIKEFAERVKESPRKISMMSFTEEGISTYVPVHAIDNLVKEMTEGKDAGKDI